jgi:Mg2+/Co2+ transporter CorC
MSWIPDAVRQLMLTCHSRNPRVLRNVDNVTGFHLRDGSQAAVPLDDSWPGFLCRAKTAGILESSEDRDRWRVDEYGGIAGTVQLEDIAEELVGRIDLAAGVEPIQQLGPFEYRLAGDLAIHDWADVLGIDLEETRLSTIGGLVTTLLGRVPRQGDVAHIGNLRFTVERVRKHRIETVILTLEPIPSDGH